MRRTIIAVVLGIITGFSPMGNLRAQISPGPLSRAHQSVNGTTQCIACHRLAMGSESLKCLECHTEIASRVNTHKGFHAVVWNPLSGNKDCARCHSDHNGENFQLIHWP